jgi:nitric oxide synthase oxygenase domain/subunit|tara:strand:- start:665 stop:874 length:210 start_codon:yes stop_codon:yes gene_type:complete
MNGVFNFVRFITYSIAAVTVRKGWNWLVQDVDPIPGTQEFNKEYYAAKEKYNRLRKKKGEYDEASRKIR